MDKRSKNRLPEQCLFMNANGEIMSIEYGKSGFRRSKLSTENRQANREIVNSYNEKHGITARVPQRCPCSPLCGLLRGWVTGLPAKPNTTDFEGFVQSCQNPASQPKHTEPPCTLYGRKKSRIKAGGRKRPPANHFAQQCWAFFALPHEVVGLRLCHSQGGRNLRKRKETKEFARSPHRWTPKKGRISHEK